MKCHKNVEIKLLITKQLYLLKNYELNYILIIYTQLIFINHVIYIYIIKIAYKR